MKVQVEAAKTSLRRERVSMQGGMLRIEIGDTLLLYNIAKDIVVVANTANKSFVRATREEFSKALRSQKAVYDKGTAGGDKWEILEAPEASVYRWKGEETSVVGCRYKAQSTDAAVRGEGPLFVYTVASRGLIGEMQTKCLPRDRVLVRTVIRGEGGIGAGMVGV